MIDRGFEVGSIGALVVLVTLGGVLVTCGEVGPVASDGPAVGARPVPLITAPPGYAPSPHSGTPDPCEEPGARVTSPRVPEPIANSASSLSPVVDAEDPCVVRGVSISEAAEAGRKQFTARGCIACHGTDLSGGIGPELRNGSPRDLPEHRIRDQSMKSGSGMPAFPNLTERELQNSSRLFAASRSSRGLVQ